MATINDLCQWINLLAQDCNDILFTGPLPVLVSDHLHNPERLKPFYLEDSKIDFLLALNFSISKYPSDIQRLVSLLFEPISVGGVVLISFQKEINTALLSNQAKFERFISLLTLSNTGLSIKSQAVLDDCDWHCWLIIKDAEHLNLPFFKTGWDDSLGEIMMRAINGSSIDQSYIETLDFPKEKNQSKHYLEYANMLVCAQNIARYHFSINCFGWSEIFFCEDLKISLISGVITQATDTEISRHASGVGESWIEASFRMTCEAIERIADSNKPSNSLAGIAFGFTQESAVSRALLEFFERYTFSKSFVIDAKPTLLDISRHSRLSSFSEQLKGIGGSKKLYLLSNNAPLSIVLALSKDRYYGLGCAYNIEEAIYKALKEVIQSNVYINMADTQEPLTTLQGLHCLTFMKNLNYDSYLKNMAGGDVMYIDNEQASKNISDFQCLLDWCYKKEIIINTETVFSSSSGDSGWVYRVTCSNLNIDKREILLAMTASNNVPFPLAITSIAKDY